jgi:8-oxo-dGTP pyrophosphatase MutT (NUDIX family)
MQTRVVVKTLIFNEDGMLLVLVRSDDDPIRPEEHDFAGGRVEPHEALGQAAVREIHEETGLEIEAAELEVAAAESTIRKTPEGKPVNIVKIFFVAKVVSPHVVLSHEHQAHDWMTMEGAIERMRYISGVELLKHIYGNRIAESYWNV